VGLITARGGGGHQSGGIARSRGSGSKPGADRLTKFRRIHAAGDLAGHVEDWGWSAFMPRSHIGNEPVLVGPGARTADRDPSVPGMEDRTRPLRRCRLLQITVHRWRHDLLTDRLRQKSVEWSDDGAPDQIIRDYKAYGDFKAAEKSRSTLPDGEFLVLLGPSVLRQDHDVAASWRFHSSRRGRVRLGDRDITSLPPWKRNHGLVFRAMRCLRHMSVARHVAFGLECADAKAENGAEDHRSLAPGRTRSSQRAAAAAITGGQQQRVGAGARAGVSSLTVPADSMYPCPISMPN